MRKIASALIASSALLVWSGTALGSENGSRPPKDGADSSDCAGLLASGPTQLITSPFQSKEDRAAILNAIQIISGPGGIIESLGLANPQHIIEMMPSEVLLALATLGRHPFAHWVDGKTVVTQGDGARGVMEFATNGCPTCRSFYRDTTDFWEQIEILFHVAGHNDFSEHSIYARSRPSDVMEHSRRLADMIAKAYVDIGKAEVSEFVQHMYATAHLQDFAKGTFEMPGATSLQTPSVLQALGGYLSPDTAPWKRELLIEFEKVQRFFPYVVQTKIMNEGWATFLMELMLKHSPWAHTAQGFRHGRLMEGVVSPSMSNPYWLGREAWNRVYSRFSARADIKAMSTQLERDRAFVAYAHAQFISNLNDSQFLSLALDESWVVKHNLLLSRPLTEEEQDPNLPPPPPGKFKKPVQKTVASRDAKTIIRSIVDQVAERGKQFPRLRIARDSKPGDIILEQDPSWGVPLTVRSIGATLYALHRVTGGSVRIRALVKELPNKRDKTTVTSLGWIDAVVSRMGTPHVYGDRLHGLSSEAVSKYLNEVKKSRNAYRDLTKRLYVELDADSKLTPAEAQEMSQTQVLRLEYLLRTLTNQAPTLAQAIQEYETMLQFSQSSAISALLSEDAEGDAVQVTARGVSIGVLPEIPEFELDRSVSESKIEGAIPSLKSPQSVWSRPLAAKQGDLDSGPYAPNEKFYGEDQTPQEGQGDGDGDGDEEGEAKEGQDPANGQRPGRTGQKPQAAKFPLDLWGKLLQKHLELPNLRRTQGLSEITETQREGGAHRPSGQIIWSRTAMDALAWGKIMLAKKGLLTPKTTQREMMTEGFKYMPQSQYTVADRDEAPQPEMSAVVVFVVDKSGSMKGEPLNIAQNAVFNILALLKAAYPKVEARFVAFDDNATESTAQDFFSNTLGGGTRYTSGIELTQDILKKFPKEKWNRYVYFFGDGDDSNEEATREGMRALAAETEFMGFGLVDPSGSRNLNSGLAAETQNLARQVPWFGWAHITKSAQSMFQALRSFFGKKPVKP